MKISNTQCLYVNESTASIFHCFSDDVSDDQLAAQYQFSRLEQGGRRFVYSLLMIGYSIHSNHSVVADRDKITKLMD